MVMRYVFTLRAKIPKISQNNKYFNHFELDNGVMTTLKHGHPTVYYMTDKIATW